ncbi:hypothetical protein ALC62_07851 [Cyphomyrmex costatus]|uniref:Uncharacterized protein n=1 Tax=Cyphomyrmex costatus TaxID=456900 RepID=A0A195CL94_9HYME|nr:hypothetical protein ALC62_07851 [Cyphomyrmex costatus]
MRSASFYSLTVEVAAARRASEINSRTCAWHDPGVAGRLLTVRGVCRHRPRLRRDRDP